VNEDLIRAELATCIRMLEYLELIDFSGHVSLRNPLKDGEILINSWGASRCRLGPQDIVRADLDGQALDENTIVPSEIHIHTAVYRRRPDINAVAHLHPPVTTALSVAGITYVPVMHHGAIFGAGVPVHDNCGHVNSAEKGDALAQTLGDCRAIIMRGHGAVAMPRSWPKPSKWDSPSRCGTMRSRLRPASGAKTSLTKFGSITRKNPV
jgi:ribulose-5-phosphate 4-epimerase/fuculose-1-phosphate aldolase